MYPRLAVKQSCVMHLLKNKQRNPDKEMADLDRQIISADLYIKVLKHKLEVGARPQVNCVNYLNNIKI